MNGRLNPAQMRAVYEVVKDKVVTDLGAGRGYLSVALIGLGAAEVVAVDKDLVGFSSMPKVRPVLSHFCEYREEVDVALVSWPGQHGADGLARIAASAETVIYLGQNTDGTVCGPRDFWEVLRFRKVLVHVPDRKNTLIIYGREEVTRMPMPEEFAALNMEKIWTYDELYRALPAVRQLP